MKKITIVLLLLFVSISSFSQHYRVRHAKGIFAGDVNFGLTKNGLAFEVGAINFRSSEQQDLGYLGYEFGKVGTTDYSNLNLTYLHQNSVYNLNENFYLNVFGGASLGLESIKNDFLDKKDNSISPGVIVGFEIESYVTNRIAALVKVQEQYKINSNLGNWTWKIQVGCRYFF